MAGISVVDIEAIENQKENIQPIRSGRSAAQLVSLFNPSATPIDLIEIRKQAHLKFQHRIDLLESALESKPIENSDDELLAQELIKDPLDIYLQYIRWTIESYPAGGTSGESKLIPLLEQVTRKFIKDSRYKQDIRYLKCWIFYANQVKTTTANDQKLSSSTTTTTKIIPNNTSSKLVLNYVIHNRIGTKFNLLYLEYYKLFMPIERLESNEEDRFKLEQVLKFGISETKKHDEEEEQTNEELIELLNQIQSISKKKKLESSKEEKLTVSKKKMMNNTKSIKKTKIKIFEDIEGEEGMKETETKDRILKDQGESSNESPFSLISTWDNLGTVNSNRKQNTLNPTKWKGQKMPMKFSKPIPSTSSSSGTAIFDHQSSPIIISSLDRPPAASTRSKIKVYEDHPQDDEQAVMKEKAESLIIQEPDDSSNPTLSSSSTTERKDDQSKDQIINPHLLDDLLTSEIQNQVNALHHLHLNQLSDSNTALDQDGQSSHVVLNFDPLQFLSS
ncbi:hypothetical protein PSTG_05130 [Puccinia striiformis f. sp. tritici PST-78]|uniref:BUB1 N-terminal domain-containing protein n=1 Tax=Puccinia striiformis f. sp. tritici PST-78 TaxID=1165861 RepID=A0A0L0VQZ3_9BASI|nr:hypothetical protein PSTG_05130 [Puccinia striiformis f. sp. tritici PST-78]